MKKLLFIFASAIILAFCHYNPAFAKSNSSFDQNSTVRVYTNCGMFEMQTKQGTNINFCGYDFKIITHGLNINKPGSTVNQIIFLDKGMTLVFQNDHIFKKF